MSSLRRHEGYLSIDHRDSPGLTPAEIELSNRLIGVELPQAAGKGHFESAFITCKHCQRSVILNPNRTRERGYCPKCDHYVCDWCNLVRIQTGLCHTIDRVIDQVQEQAADAAAIQEV